jgi:Ca-activated chloride channel family protein
MKKQVFVLFFFFMLIFNGFAQAIFSFENHDFGSLEAWDYRHVDLKITNSSSRKQCVLQVKYPREVECLYMQECVMADSSISFRFFVNPPSKGRFEYTVEVLLGSEVAPTKIILKGNMIEDPVYDASALTNCPDFKNPVIQKPAMESTKLTVVTIDRSTRKFVPSTQVSMTRNGEVFWSRQTGTDGKIKERGVSGLYFFYAVHPDYEPEEKGVNISKQQHYVIIELMRKVTDEPFSDSFIDSTTTKTQWTDSLPENQLITIDTNRYFTSFDSDDFDSAYFKPVNLVFVLDISGSMNQEGKLDLMKTSLNRLVDVLRPEDRIGLVVYADKAKTVMPSTSGNQKDAIRKTINALVCGGYTAGGAGIELGYEVLRTNHISGGRNELLIVTDGAFNKGTEAYKSVVYDQAMEGYSLSVIGIKNNESDESNMRSMVTAGNGVFIEINDEQEAQQELNLEIRKRAFKGKTD